MSGCVGAHACVCVLRACVSGEEGGREGEEEGGEVCVWGGRRGGGEEACVCGGLTTGICVLLTLIGLSPEVSAT